MNHQQIPSTEQIKSALAGLNMAGLQVVADKSGVPFHTLRKIRDGETENPRIETVRQFWPVVQESTATPTPTAIENVANE